MDEYDEYDAYPEEYPEADAQEYDAEYGQDEGDELEGYGGEEGEVEVEYEEEGEFKEEFGAFDRAGSSSVFNKFPETEEEFFYQNMVTYALRMGITPNDVNELRKLFSVLVKNYPHPRFLHPGVCFAMRTFQTPDGKYEWNRDKYVEHKQRLLNISEFTLIRYILIFNKFT